MKKYYIDFDLAAEQLTNIGTHLTQLRTEFAFTVGLDEDERKRLLRLGFVNETFSRGIIEAAKQHPQLVPPGISVAKLERDLENREQLLPVLVQLQSMTKLLEDTMILLGVDIYNGARGLYKTLQVLGEAHGLAEILDELGRRFAKKSRQKPKDPATGGGGTGTNPTSTP